MKYSQNEHEIRFIKSFVLPAKQARYLGFVTKPKRRNDFTKHLAHFTDLSSRHIYPLQNTGVDPERLLQLLRSKGAGDSCYIISEWGEIDGTEMLLMDALSEVNLRQMGTVLSMIPGKLAYYIGESGEQRVLLFKE